MMLKFRLIALTVCFTLGLGACIGMPFRSMLELRKLSPLETDPAQFSIAVVTHKAVQFNNSAVTLTIGFNSDTPNTSFESVSQASIAANADVEELQEAKKPDDNISLFFLDDQAAEKMRVAQRKIKAFEQQNIKGEGSFSVGIDIGCFTTAKPNKLLASVYARFNQEQGYILLNSNIDLLGEAEKASEANLWVQCNEQQSESTI